MTEMRRVWVDKTLYEDHFALHNYLAGQGLSRFYVEVAREDDKVLIDVHAKQDPPLSIVPRHDPLSSNKRCDNRTCPLCSTISRPRLTPDYRPVEEYDTGVLYGEPKPRDWDKPLTVGTDTDFIPVIPDEYRESKTAIIITWAGAVILGLAASFVVIRMWYVQFGCPFWPDHGLLSACKALTIKVGKP